MSTKCFCTRRIKFCSNASSTCHQSKSVMVFQQISIPYRMASNRNISVEQTENKYMVQQHVNTSHCNESSKPPFWGTNFTIVWKNADVAFGLWYQAYSSTRPSGWYQFEDWNDLICKEQDMVNICQHDVKICKAMFEAINMESFCELWTHSYLNWRLHVHHAGPSNWRN